MRPKRWGGDRAARITAPPPCTRRQTGRGERGVSGDDGTDEALKKVTGTCMKPEEAYYRWMQAARKAFRAKRGDLVEKHFPYEDDITSLMLVLLAARITRDIERPSVMPSAPGVEVYDETRN